ncbi:MAG: hypothetical protein M3151_08195 [Actinomycetota bacterium]|nr:hypothetical protein [Actinomycetota bacterium]
MANELTSYRESIALVIRELRPDVEVIEVDSGALNQQVLRLSPDLVICSRVTSVVRDHAPNWVELYPDCEDLSRIYIGGESSTVQDVQLSDLLSLVDRLEPRLGTSSGQPGAESGSLVASLRLRVP